MSENTIVLTDEELLEAIETSLLDDYSKSDLVSLLPRMARKEKAELSKILAQSKEAVEKADGEYSQGIVKVQKDFNSEMKTFEREQVQNIQAIQKSIDESALKGMEREMNA